MSEKRRRKEQRRQRRKAKGASRAQARANSTDRLLAQAARLATASIANVTDALEAELWASSLFGDWHQREDPDAVSFPSLVQAFEAIGTAPALASLRALSAIDDASRARAAADRLAESGLPEPEWASALGHAQPTAAVLLEETDFDDGVTVLIEFDDSLVLDLYIDHNLGGLVRDVYPTRPLAEVLQDVPDYLAARHIGLDEARARVEAALDVLDHTLDPPVEEAVWTLRAMIDSRLRLLPDGFALPDDVFEVETAERDALLTDFLASPDGKRWSADEDAEFVIRYAIDFGADYNHGGPLRWSPIVVEVFMTDWLPRKVMAEPEFFARVPDVLPDWVRYAGGRRGVPASSVQDAVAAVEQYREDLILAAADPDAWSLATAIADAAIEAGIDPTDDAALARFMRDDAEGPAT